MCGTKGLCQNVDLMILDCHRDGFRSVAYYANMYFVTLAYNITKILVVTLMKEKNRNIRQWPVDIMGSWEGYL